jgi:hypothetical protein
MVASPAIAGMVLGASDGTIGTCRIVACVARRIGLGVAFTIAASIAVLALTLTNAQHTPSVKQASLPLSEITPCTSGLYGADIEVTIYGDGDPCLEWDRRNSGAGDFWRELNEPREETLVCSMQRKDGPLIEVRDTGSASYGTRICAHLTARGWIEARGPGAEREAEHRSLQAAHEAEERAHEAEERKRQEREWEANQRKIEAEQRKIEAQSKREAAESEGG